MRRLPVRLRLTLAFTLAMAIVLAAVGAFLYVRLGDTLLEQLDESIQARADILSALVRERGGDLAGTLTAQDDDGFVQLARPDGSLLASSPQIAAGLLVPAEDLARARSESFYLERDEVAELDGEPARMLVTSVDGSAVTFTLVVGASLQDREDALDGLLAQLLIGGPLALLLSALAGYLLAAAAFRPVEAMRRRASQVSSEHPGQRLPLPDSHDEIRRLGETLNEMLARLEAGLARERRFVADASHELRTPLALLKTELELALRHPRTSDELEQSVRSAADEVDRLTRLAEDLLVLARLHEDRLQLRRAPTSSRELLDAVARRFADRASAGGRPLEVVPSVDEQIVGDRIRLEQALGNLVDNALRHGAGTIRLEAERRDGSIELRVSDEGAGFPPEFLPRAFERFARADEARGGGAAGLGLAIVDAVARAHGGTARAVNGDRRGAIVYLTLPDTYETTSNSSSAP